MYIVDLVKRLATKENIPVVIYLVLNVFISGFLLYLFPAMSGTAGNFLPYLGVGFVLYVISVFVALSPVGEFIIRLQTGCKKIKRVDQINYIEPLFREVYEKAKLANPEIPNDVQLFINQDDSANAFATGRKTVCVTKGLLMLPPEDIKAVLGHELGHIAHKDTDLIMLISAGNFIVNGFILVIRAIIAMFNFIAAIVGMFMGGSEGAVYRAMQALGQLLITAIVGLLVKLWTKLGIILCMKSSRGHEFLADEFSFNLGYGEALCAFLNDTEDSKPEGLFATLASSHPSSDDRIGRLQELGVQFRSTYTGMNTNTSTPVFGQPQPMAAASFKVSPAMGVAPVQAVTSVPQSVASNDGTFACPSCGNMLAAGSKFCNSCGEKIETPSKLVCPNCGKEAEEDDSAFCVYCGTKLN